MMRQLYVILTMFLHTLNALGRPCVVSTLTLAIHEGERQHTAQKRPRIVTISVPNRNRIEKYKGY